MLCAAILSDQFLSNYKNTDYNLISTAATSGHKNTFDGNKTAWKQTEKTDTIKKRCWQLQFVNATS